MAGTFHRIWFGQNDRPESYDSYWDAWRRQYPDCEFKTWTDADIGEFEMAKEALDRVKSNVSRADIARYEILYRFGGIYLDCDIMPYNHFSFQEMTETLTVCNETESTDYCSIGFIASPTGHPVFRDMIEHITKSDIDETRPNVSTGPWLFGAALKHHPHRRLPVAAFYPYLYDEPFSAIRAKNLDKTLGIHVWGGAWLSPEQKKEKALQLLRKGDIVEPAEILAGYDDQWSNDVRYLLQTIEDIRTKSATVAPALGQNLTIDAATRSAFEFGKVLHWLLERDPDHMIWQIGAADGILVDPLRPAMVNFDPPAMLLEPNPYLFEMLEAGYRKNRKIALLPLAYSSNEGDLVLNAINPEKAAAQNLPRWVLGISSIYTDKNAIGGLTIDDRTTQLIQLCIERITVPTISFTELVDRAGGRQPDILVVDAEGMDKPIIEDILDRQCLPAVIHFEIQCMEESDQTELTTRLSENYTLIQFGNDVTAYRNDIILDYAKSIYIENGQATIFGPALRQINGI